MVTWFFDLISGQMRRAESKHATISDALKINGILPPLQFPPPGIKRDFRGIHRQSVPTKKQKQLCPAISRQGAGRSNTLGLLAPDLRQGIALHPNQVQHAESREQGQ